VRARLFRIQTGHSAADAADGWHDEHREQEHRKRDEQNRLKGMLTDRDIVVKALAQGKDPRSTTVGEFAEGKPVTIGADDSWTRRCRRWPITRCAAFR
jgi:TPP-dependent pyruvate/acetoin dehydrogenase alpha subunit